MVLRSVTVKGPLGMHARAAARFVHAATAFESQVRVGRDSQEMDGKSILGILLLSAGRGTVITISAAGSDEVAALDTLCRLVESDFAETP
jgi:phosphotransferase system HPr (HPr) family protein